MDVQVQNLLHSVWPVVYADVVALWAELFIQQKLRSVEKGQ